MDDLLVRRKVDMTVVELAALTADSKVDCLGYQLVDQMAVQSAVRMVEKTVVSSVVPMVANWAVMTVVQMVDLLADSLVDMWAGRSVG